MNILIVDDEHLIRKWLILFIRQAGLDIKPQICEAASGAEALEHIRRQPFDLMITDIKMPVMDGIELIRHAKPLQPHLTVVVLSAYSELNDVKTALRAGAQDYILKAEMQPQDIRHILETAAANRLRRPGPPETAAGFSCPASPAAEAAEPAAPDCLPDRPIHNAAIRSAVRYIRQHYAEKMSLERISRSVYLNDSYFSQLFKKETGMSFTDYVEAVRIRAACGALAQTDDRIGDIAAAVGFAGQAYFAKQFKKATGLSPMAYRRRMRRPGGV